MVRQRGLSLPTLGKLRVSLPLALSPRTAHGTQPARVLRPRIEAGIPAHDCTQRVCAARPHGNRSCVFPRPEKSMFCEPNPVFPPELLEQVNSMLSLEYPSAWRP